MPKCDFNNVTQHLRVNFSEGDFQGALLCRLSKWFKSVIKTLWTIKNKAKNVQPVFIVNLFHLLGGKWHSENEHKPRKWNLNFIKTEIILKSDKMLNVSNTHLSTINIKKHQDKYHIYRHLRCLQKKNIGNKVVSHPQ